MELSADKQTILHCIDSLGLGGAEVLLRDTLPLLGGFNNIVCYLHPPESLATDFKDYPLYCLNYSSKLSTLKAVKALKKIIQKHRVSIIHSHLFYSSLLSRLACPKEVRLFFTIHNILSRDAFEVNRFSLIAEKLTYKKRHHIIAVSHEALNDYDKWVGIKGKADVLYNYVSQKFFDLQYSYNQEVKGSFKLVAVGNLRRQKNYPALLKAMDMVKDIPVTLDIYGSGDLQEELQKAIGENQLNVRLMGRVDDVSEILLNYHAYIMPSLFEGFGIAPMEAMAAGMPVLLSDLPVFKEIGGDLPEYFDPGSPASIANTIRNSFQNWNSVKEKAANGKERIRNKASKEIYFKKLSAIYSSQ
jgi:glycosyltransferase involved in cell wall biosynthesis